MDGRDIPAMCEKLELVKSHFSLHNELLPKQKVQLTRLSLAISRLRLQPLLKQQVTSPRMMKVDHFRSDPSEEFLLNNSHHFEHFSPILNLFSPIPSLKVLAIHFRSSL